MTSPANVYVSAAVDSDIQEAAQIAAIVHAEVRPLASALFDRFLALLESLTPEEWQAPTYCTEWTVRDIVAHEAGGYESGTSFGAFRRTWLRLPERGRPIVDTINAAQIRARAGRSPDELIAELRDVGPRAIAARGRLSALVRSIPIPIPPMGICRAGYLTDDIYLRDAWIHTIDISHATGRPLRLNADVDGRIVALLVRDLSLRLSRLLAGKAIVFDIGGPAGGSFRVGPSTPPSATIRMDAVDFGLRSSERISVDKALARSQLSGDIDLARFALEHSFILY